MDFSQDSVCTNGDATTSPSSINELHSLVSSICQHWVDQTLNDDTVPLSQVKLCKISSQPSSSTQPLVVTHSLLIDSDCTWQLFVYNHKVVPSPSSPLSMIPAILNPSAFSQLICAIDSSTICPGNPDIHFVEMGKSRNDKFIAADGETKAIIENGFPIVLNGATHTATVRNTDCDILIHGAKCRSCHDYRAQLRAMYSRYKKQKSTKKSKYCNNRFLSPSEKDEKCNKLQENIIAANKEISKLSVKLEEILKKSGITVDTDLHDELLDIMGENNHSVLQKFPSGSFRRLFWEEQLKAARATDARQMRWHPMIIRWCLNLKLLSSSAYHSLRTAGFIKLPSERTLRDYTNFFQSKAGFQSEVDTMLLKEAQLDKLPSWKRYVVLLFDEMKVSENLVYDKHHAQVIGFVQAGNINDELTRLEDDNSSSPPVAKHILTLMVRGVFSNLRFPYAHFATKDLSGAELFNIIWEAIERLEYMGFKVIALTGDGASCNRKFFKLHTSDDSDEICYKTPNPYTDEKRDIYFISDVPHLLKTIRNCWSHSFAHGCFRKLWVN